MEEKKDVMKALGLYKSNCFCPSLLTLTSLIVNTKAYPLISLGTTPSILSSTLIDWEAVKLF